MKLAIVALLFLAGSYAGASVIPSPEAPAEVKSLKQSRVTLEVSNMPIAWQVEAAEDLDAALALHSSNESGVNMFANLFQERHSQFYWNAVLDYQHLYFVTRYFVRLRTDDDALVFLFSGERL